MPTLRCVAEFGIAGDGRDSCTPQPPLPLQLWNRIHAQHSNIFMDQSLSSHSLSLWKQQGLLQISEHCSRIAYSCSWDTLSSSSCSAIGWKGSPVSPGLGQPDSGSCWDWCVGVASGCCILPLGQASPKRWYQVSAATSCVCSPAYISQPWCNMGKDKRFTADMLAMLQNSALNLNPNPLFTPLSQRGPFVSLIFGSKTFHFWGDNRGRNRPLY